jgi:hypothetical protein
LADIKISAITSADPTTATDIIGNIGVNTRRFTIKQAVNQWISAAGDILYGTGTSDSTRLAIGSAGKILESTGGIPAWRSKPTSGHITTVGTTGQILKTGEGPAAEWVDDIFISTAGSSGETEIGMGTTNPGGKLHLASENDATGFLLDNYGGTSAARPIMYLRSARGSLATPSAVSSGDQSIIIFQFHDGTNFVSGGQIAHKATQDWTGSAHGAKMTFWTNDEDATTRTERMHIGADGRIRMGSTVAATTDLDVAGGFNADTVKRATTDYAGIGIGTDHQVLESSNGVHKWVSKGDIIDVADPTSEAILVWDTTATTWAQVVLDPNELLRVSTAGALEVIAAPSSAAVLVYSTVDTSGPQWLETTAGGLFHGDAAGRSTFLSVGSDGQMLHSTVGLPAWKTVGSIVDLADPTSEAVAFWDGSEWDPIFLDANELLRVSTAGALEAIAPPSSGAILRYSTADTSGAEWLIMDPGEMLSGTSILAIGSSGQYLQSTGGVPTWVTLTDPSTGHITTAGTSGQILQTTGGAAVWKDQSDITGTPDPSTGHITTAGSSGTVLITSSGGAAIWSTAIFVNTSQLVGVGTTTPEAKFEVFIKTAANPALRLNTNFSGGNSVNINPFRSAVSNAGFEIEINDIPVIRIDSSAGNTTITGTLTVNGDQTGATDHVFDDYNDIKLLEKWRAGEELPFKTGDMLNRDRLLRDTIIQLHKRIEILEGGYT